jgi:release factor glutamine methyltransferase
MAASPISSDQVVATLRQAGCIAAEEEAAELIELVAGDGPRLADLLTRRCTGEPLAWLVGSVQFCGQTVLVQPGVYVPRWQSEPMARAAALLLPEVGVAVDLCTGSGAIAVVLTTQRPQATVLATDIDPLAIACARANGVVAYQGNMASALPDGVAGVVDVVVAVVPYVPTDELQHLPRDVVTFEPLQALDGGPQGIDHLISAVRAGAVLLRPGGSLLLELGGDEANLLLPVLSEYGFSLQEHLIDEDDELRAIICRG